MRIPAKRVIPAILKIIEVFRENKRPGDSLASWIHRVVGGHEDSGISSVGDIKRVLEPLAAPPPKEDDPGFYADYGSDGTYHTKTGRGECAA